MYDRKLLMFLSGAWVVAVALLFVSASAHASHAPSLREMSRWIRDSELIVIADVQEGGRGTTLLCREVLKGPPDMVHKTVTLAPQMPSFNARLQPGRKGVAVLLKKGRILDAYGQTETIAALRKLVPVYDLPSERDRLKELHTLLLPDQENRFVVQRFFEALYDEFKRVQDPESLPLMTRIVRETKLSYVKMQLIRQLGWTGDPRVVPALIEIMRSSDVNAHRSAAQTLSRHFPGAPGVTEAFREALSTEGMDVVAARYLMKREPSPELEAVIDAYEAERAAKRTEKERRAVRKRWVLEQGNPDAIKTYYLRTATDETLPDSERIVAAREVAGSLSVSGKDRLRASILPVVRKVVGEEAGYTSLTDVALVLRGLNHPDCRDLLIDIRRRQKPSSLRKASWIATAAIRELGPEERAREEKTWRYALPGPTTRDAKDEGRRLIKRLSAILEDEPGQKTDEMYWIVYRLGNLEERRAVPVLLDCLDVTAGWSEWQARDVLTEAFVNIGGSKVERAMKKMLPHPKESFLMKLRGEQSLVKMRRSYKVKREIAFNVLWELKRERFLPELRRMVTKGNYGLKAEAMRKLGLIGTPKDLDILLPSCDFWAEDRSLHNRAMNAVAAIRDRHNYDINGRISKK